MSALSRLAGAAGAAAVAVGLSTSAMADTTPGRENKTVFASGEIAEEYGLPALPAGSPYVLLEESRTQYSGGTTPKLQYSPEQIKEYVGKENILPVKIHNKFILPQDFIQLVENRIREEKGHVLVGVLVDWKGHLKPEGQTLESYQNEQLAKLQDVAIQIQTVLNAGDKEHNIPRLAKEKGIFVNLVIPLIYDPAYVRRSNDLDNIKDDGNFLARLRSVVPGTVLIAVNDNPFPEQRDGSFTHEAYTNNSDGYLQWLAHFAQFDYHLHPAAEMPERVKKMTEEMRLSGSIGAAAQAKRVAEQQGSGDGTGESAEAPNPG